MGVPSEQTELQRGNSTGRHQPAGSISRCQQLHRPTECPLFSNRPPFVSAGTGVRGCLCGTAPARIVRGANAGLLSPCQQPALDLVPNIIERPSRAAVPPKRPPPPHTGLTPPCKCPRRRLPGALLLRNPLPGKFPHRVVKGVAEGGVPESLLKHLPHHQGG